MSDFSKVTWQKTEQASNLEPRTLTLPLPGFSSPQRRERVLWTLFSVDLFLLGAECVPWEPTPVAVESLAEGSLAGLVAGWPGCHGREEVICWGLSGAVTQRTWLSMPKEARAPLVEAPRKVDAGSVCLCRRCLYPQPHDTRCPSMVRSSVWARTSQAIPTLPGFPRAWLLSVTTSAPGRASQVTPPANPALLPVSRQGAEPGGAGLDSRHTCLFCLLINISKNYLFFYLTGPGLSCSLQALIFSCSMRTLSCGMWNLVP